MVFLITQFIERRREYKEYTEKMMRKFQQADSDGGTEITETERSSILSFNEIFNEDTLCRPRLESPRRVEEEYGEYKEKMMRKFQQADSDGGTEITETERSSILSFPEYLNMF